MSASDDIRHATSVAMGSRGLYIFGPAGSGKSALALSLIAMGCELVADDRTMLTRDGDMLIADAPGPIRGMIEARGVGLLRAPVHGPVPLRLAVDMGRLAGERLPSRQTIALEVAGASVSLPLLAKVEAAHFAHAVLLCLRHGFAE